MGQSQGGLSGSVGKCSVVLSATRGGRVRMFGFAVTRERYERQAVRRLSVWARDYLLRAAVADLGCGTLGVFVAAQLRFGNEVAGTYVALSLALPVLWLGALWRAG